MMNKMYHISKLTSNKTKIFYILFYFFYTITYITSPIITMLFINSVEIKNFEKMVIFAIVEIVDHFIFQIICFILDIFEGKVENENFVNYHSIMFNKIRSFKKENDMISDNELSQYLGQYYEKSQNFFFINKVDYVFSIIKIIIIYVIFFVFDWRVGLLLLVLVPLMFLATKAYEKKLYVNSTKNVNNSDKVKEYINDQHKLYKNEVFSNRKQLINFKQALNIFKKDYRKSVKDKSVFLNLFSYSFLNFTISISILVGGFLTYLGVFSIGILYVFQDYTSQLWTPCEFLVSYKKDYQEAKPILEKIEKMLSVNEVTFNQDKITSIKLIDFVSLNEKQEPLFNPLNYEFTKGNTYLIKGENGGGKTTLVESIMGFTDRHQGQVLINGCSDLFDDFSYICADAYISPLFDDNNKTKRSSGEEKLAQLNFYLEQNKSVIILDEPTNFVDVNNKKKVFSLIEGLGKDKIIIIISHDSEVKYLADSVIELS